MDIKTRFSNSLVGLVIIFLAFLYHHKSINDFPSHIHGWAQSDRYALAMGFVDNDLNLFKPQTYIYNKQFPDNWEKPATNTITAVDFPIHDFIPAVVMKWSGNHSPWIFRIYILMYSLVGLFYLFKLAFKITGDYSKSLFTIVFAATSPVFVYYQSGFLPTIPSLANSIIGLYFFYGYSKNNEQRFFVYSILFFTLATLSRTTFAIPLLAVLMWEFIRIIKKETSFLPKILPISISILILISYQFYNAYLRFKYGSNFLNQLMPASNFNDALEIIKDAFNNWGFQYFTWLHYLIYLLLTAILVVLIIRKVVIFNKEIVNLGLLFFIYFTGCVLFTFLMLRQFPAHDYYFLDTFYLPLILFLTIILSLIPKFKHKKHKVLFLILLFFVSVSLIIQPIKSQNRRSESLMNDKTQTTINNYRDASAYLDTLGISKESNILVLDAVCPNIPFLLMQRKGFAVMNTSYQNIENSLDWPFDFIVFQDEYFLSDIYSEYPEILSKLNKIADNGKISVCTLSKNVAKQSLIEFVGLKHKIPVVVEKITFENTPDIEWQNTKSSAKLAFTGNYSGYLSSDMFYGLTYKTSNFSELEKNPSSMLVSAYFLRNSISNIELVASISENNEMKYYKKYNLCSFLTKQNTWEQLDFVFQLPQIKSDNYEFAIYILNAEKGEINYDDFSFSIY